MKKHNPRRCVNCGEVYQPMGPAAKYCETCKPIFKKIADKRGRDNHYRKMGRMVGVGSGGLTGSGKDNFMYKHGRCVFRRWAKERKEEIGLCEDCGKDIRNAQHYEWVGHHKDHNPTNNTIENLKLLCKRCHQIEHECWKAFEGVTTIPEGSRADNRSKRLASDKDDDIV